jgi:hypothetical protein
MTVEPPPDYREEVDIVRIDPLFLERQRNRYASRGVAFLVILNGIAALILLSNFLRLHPQVENAPTVAAAMVVFGAGVAAALASMFFAYLRRTVRLWAPGTRACSAHRVVARPDCCCSECSMFRGRLTNGWHRYRPYAQNRR